MERRAEADVVLVGLGAAGGVAAHVLTAAGIEVVALEAGPRVDAGMMTLDEVRNDVRAWLSRPKSSREIPTWRSDENENSYSSPYPMLMVNAVGGTTVHYNCASPRMQPWDFESRTRTLDRYGLKAIPEGSTLADWPISYEDLEPFYEQMEEAIGVSGLAGNIDGQPREGGNPFDGRRRTEYPMPALEPSGWNKLMADAARDLGWHPSPMPAAINTVPYDGRPVCTNCGFCSNNGCYRDAKGSTDVTLIPRAEATGRLRVETGARVTRIEVDDAGRATGVRYVQDGKEYVQPGRAVLLGGFVYENTRLLLLSKSSNYPDGLSNNHGQVGKHYMAHVNPYYYGLFQGRRLNRFNGSGGQITIINDWNGDNFDHRGLGFIGGAQFTAMQELKAIVAANGPFPPGVPRWGAAWKSWLQANAQSVGCVNADIGNLSYETSYLDLDPSAKDPYGVPLVRVTHKPEENERRAWAFVTGKLTEWLNAAGAVAVWPRGPITFETRHPYGGTRMGNDPATSVLDRYGFSHEVGNLGLLGASVFPTTSGLNPTLTLQAVSWLTAQHLLDNWEERALRS
jgi:gluconate 2-dehydrogenase alpha chain